MTEEERMKNSLKALQLATEKKTPHQTTEDATTDFMRGFAECAIFFLNEEAKYPALFREGELSEEDLRFFGGKVESGNIVRLAEEIAMRARLKRDEAKTE